jgi:hypothetical protein
MGVVTRINEVIDAKRRVVIHADGLDSKAEGDSHSCVVAEADCIYMAGATEIEGEDGGRIVNCPTLISVALQ